MATTKPESDNSSGQKHSRRGVLVALAAGAGTGLVAALADASSHNESLSLGGNSRASAAAAHRYGSVSLAPQTIPPDDTVDQLAWFFGDDLGVAEFRAPDSLPASWTASGIEWGAATDLATARQQAGEPGLALAFESGDLVVGITSPDNNQRWTHLGLEIVFGGTLSGTRNTWSGSEPAVLFCATEGGGMVEVRLP